MTDSTPPSSRYEGAIAAVTDVSGRLLSTLPPAFLLMVLLNIGFLSLVFWFLGSQMDQRTALVGKLLEHCVEAADDSGATRARLDALEHDIRVLEAKKAP